VTKEEYQETQMRLVMLRQLADGIPLNEFLRAIERTDALGPILDPTLWMKGHRELGKIRELARALQAFAMLPLPAYVEASDRP
jgi:hypothetical protein